MLKNWRAKEEDVDAIAAARQKDPFAVLGPHLTAEGWAIRAFVTDALSVRGIPAVEILSESSYRIHKLTPFARVEGTRITYPPGQATLPL